jgi:hypothetical protein
MPDVDVGVDWSVFCALVNRRTDMGARAEGRAGSSLSGLASASLRWLRYVPASQSGRAHFLGSREPSIRRAPSIPYASIFTLSPRSIRCPRWSRRTRRAPAVGAFFIARRRRRSAPTVRPHLRPVAVRHAPRNDCERAELKRATAFHEPSDRIVVRLDPTSCSDRLLPQSMDLISCAAVFACWSFASRTQRPLPSPPSQQSPPRRSRGSKNALPIGARPVCRIGMQPRT